jgi:hypothetical protein
MAHMNQERKAKFAPRIKAILKKYGMKGSLSVRHSMCIVLKITSGELDIIGNYNAKALNGRNWNGYPLRQITDGYMEPRANLVNDYFTDKCLSFMKEVFEVLYDGNHNNSDIMTDYYDVGWYVEIRIGEWDKPYICTSNAAMPANVQPLALLATTEPAPAEPVDTFIHYGAGI